MGKDREGALRPAETSVSRDAGSLNKREKNGEKFFWSRSNGLAMAGTVRVLADLPSDDPLRPQYIELLREMAASVAAAQQSDGLWRPGLLDAKSYPLPEVSVRRSSLTPLRGASITACWMRRFTCQSLRSVGRDVDACLCGWAAGAIQPIGEAQAEYKPGSSYNFGVGAFLLAGSEMDVLSEHKHW